MYVPKIKIDLEALDRSISEMKTLQQKCDSCYKTPPAVTGGGKAVNQIEAIAQMYKTLNIEMGTLISSTISFLEYAKQLYDEKNNIIIENIMPESGIGRNIVPIAVRAAKKVYKFKNGQK